MPTGQGADGDAEDLVSTGIAAKAVGVAHNTLHRWWIRGVVTPAFITVGGHARWNVEDLREQIRNLRSSGQAN